MKNNDYYVIGSERRSDWLEVIGTAEQLDISYHPDYIATLERLSHSVSPYGGKGHLFVYEGAGKRVIYPFMLKPLSELNPEWSGNDVSSPYGYSGPTCISGDLGSGPVIDGFRNAFDEYCQNSRIVTEFTRVNPLLPRCDSGTNGRLMGHGPIVYVNLLNDLQQINAEHNKECRYSIRKATQSRVTIRRSKKTPSDIITFKQLYDGTMKRNEAKEGYYFPESFYHSIARMDESTLLIAENDGQAVSAAWFLAYGNNAQYFLSGSNNEGRRLCASNLLLAEAIELYKMMGMRTLCLGGGYGNKDTLLRFKLSFAPTTRIFCTYRKVHDREAFDMACQSAGVSNSLEQFFPPYRNTH